MLTRFLPANAPSFVSVHATTNVGGIALVCALIYHQANCHPQLGGVADDQLVGQVH